MKKTLKIVGFSLLAIVVVVALAVGVAAYVVFTPERITPIVVEQASGFVDGEVELGSIDLSLDFPNFGVEIHNLKLGGKPTAADSAAGCFDNGAKPVLVSVERCFLAIDVMEFYKHRNVVVQGVELSGVNVDARIDANGVANFDVVRTDTSAPQTVADTAIADTGGGLFFDRAELKFFKISNANIAFADHKQKLNACVKNLHVDLSGLYENEQVKGKAELGADNISFAMPNMSGAIAPLAVAVNATATGNVYTADVALGTSLSTLAMNRTTLAQNLRLALDAALSFDSKSSRLALQKADLKLADISLAASGEVNTDTAFSAFDMSLAYSLSIPSLKNLIALVPVALVPEVQKVQAGGHFAVEGKVEGVLRDSTQMPYVSGSITTDVDNARYTALPYLLETLTAKIGFGVDLSAKPKRPSYAAINELRAAAAGSRVAVTGRVSELLGDPLADVKVIATADLATLVRTLKLQDMDVKGSATANLSAKLRVSDAVNQRIERILASGTVELQSIACALPKDTINATISSAKITFGTNRSTRLTSPDAPRVIDASLTWQGLRAQMGKELRASSRRGNVSIAAGNPLVQSSLPKVDCRFKLDGTTLRMDSIRVRLAVAQGSAKVRPSAQNHKLPKVELRLQTDSLRAAAFGNVAALTKGTTNVNAEQLADTSKGFGGWLAKLNVSYNDAQMFSPSFPEMVHVDLLQAEVSDEVQSITQCRVRVGKSDFELSGSVQDLLAWTDKKKTLRAKLRLAGESIDINELMQIADAGSDAAPTTADVESERYVAEVKSAAVVDTTPPVFGAVMLPNDIFAEFETDIRSAKFSNMELENIKGGVTLADGALILRELGVVANKKSRMKLTAIYRTPERNHIYAGVEYHLMGIELGDLQDIVPDVDSLLPMLRSFEGKVDFHIAAQTYLDSLYHIKFSTLRAMSSIHGENLVLLDNATFAQISKMLLFKNKKHNVIDSLSVEVVAFKSDVEIYPFLVSMDRYKVALGGKHKLNMQETYHISVLESPLPTRLGVDIKGDLNDIIAHPASHVKLVKPRYEATFMPDKKNVTQGMDEDIRNQIRDALKRAAE